MKRLLLLLFACAGLVLGVAHAAPARLPYEPEKPPELPPAPLDLRGSTWRGHCFADTGSACTITLEPGGTLTYRDAMPGTWPGTWRLTGNLLVIEINQFSEHRGTVSGIIVQGDSSNKIGMRGKFKLQRVLPGE